MQSGFSVPQEPAASTSYLSPNYTGSHPRYHSENLGPHYKKIFTDPSTVCQAERHATVSGRKAGRSFPLPLPAEVMYGAKLELRCNFACTWPAGRGVLCFDATLSEVPNRARKVCRRESRGGLVWPFPLQEMRVSFDCVLARLA